MDSNEYQAIMLSEEVQPLDSEFDIEELILSVDVIDKKIDWYKKLKEQRTKKLNEEVEKLEKRKDFTKKVIIATLNSKNLKSLNFPGIGKVSCKSSKGKWTIEDEETLLEFLKSEVDNELYNKIIVMKPSIIKKELNKLLDIMEKIDKIPSCVKHEGLDDQVLSISIEEEAASVEKRQSITENLEEIEYKSNVNIPNINTSSFDEEDLVI
jgi:hypothetical protein